jgi:carbamoyl-phosphate synthase large subunit
LASKATGFPIAKIAAKLAVGYTLDELDNDITRVTPASFEPTIDYVVTKMPRFTFEKFPGAEPTLTTAMKSVGEAMSIGRSFAESLQKALRSMETGLTGLNEVRLPGVVGKDGAVDREELLIRLGEPRPDRLLAVAQALRYGAGLEEIATATRIDPWFLRQIADLVAAEEQLRRHGLPDDGFQLRRLKRLGFCDARLAELTGLEDAAVAEHRRDAGLVPVYKRIDTSIQSSLARPGPANGTR